MKLCKNVSSLQLFTQQFSKFQVKKLKMINSGLPLKFSSVLATKWNEKGKQQERKEVKQAQQKNQKTVNIQPLPQGLQIIEQLFKTTTSGYYRDFSSAFVFGVDMKIWRKGRTKDVVVFTDCNIPNFLWIATKTKTFLFDLIYTNLENSDVQLYLSQQIKFYFVLVYFQEKIPFIFEDFATFKKIRTLFYSAIFQHQNHRPDYPPYLSKLIKYLTVSQLLDENKKTNSALQVLKIAEQLVGVDKRSLYEDILEEMIYQKVQIKNSKENFYEHCLNAEEIMMFFKIACCNQNIKAIFEYYSGVGFKKKSDYVTFFMKSDQFCCFLVKQQKLTEDQAKKITERNFRMGLTFYQFCNFLSNKQYNYLALNPPVDQDLPLNQYFCYSSHNTYLCGNQITSDSKIERYLQDLTNGVKCLQIDVHESGDKLIVTHALNGLHLNKEVSFEEVVKEIANYCKQTKNFYPLILSIQNRTSKENYSKIANIFVKNLGNYLLDLKDGSRNDKIIKCHTLADLKNKVIIKTDAKIKDLLSLQKKQQTQIMDVSSKHSKTASLNYDFNIKAQKFQKKVRNYEDRKNAFQKQFKERCYLPSEQITRVTALFKSEQGVNNQNSVGYQSSSVTNKKLQQFEWKKLQDYTKRSFLRVYPLGTQIGSGNYNPIPALERGAQIIALNTQTKDIYAWLMMSYFTAGATQSAENIGYIAKPRHLRSNINKQKVVQTISISILSTIITTKIKFFGTSTDMKKNQENTLNFQIEDYQVGFLMFEMENGLRDCIPTRFIREGYRVIIGRNSNYIDCGVRVLLRVKVRYICHNSTDLHLR